MALKFNQFILKIFPLLSNIVKKILILKEFRFQGGKDPKTYENKAKKEDDKDDGDDDGFDEEEAFDYDENAAMGYYDETQYNNYLKGFRPDCFTNDDVKYCEHDPKNENYLYDSRPYFANICFPIAPKVVKYATVFGDFSNGIIGDLRTAAWIILASVFIAIIFA